MRLGLVNVQYVDQVLNEGYNIVTVHMNATKRYAPREVHDHK